MVPLGRLGLGDERRFVVCRDDVVQFDEGARPDDAVGMEAVVALEDHDLGFDKRYLNNCPKELRIYIGCALQLYGDLESINLIKVHIQSGKVTLMVYDGFESEAIPLLSERIKICENKFVGTI